MNATPNPLLEADGYAAAQVQRWVALAMHS